VNDGANEMRRHTVVATCADDVVPQLPTFLLSPRVGSLVNRYHELGGLLEKGEQLGFGGFHTLTTRYPRQCGAREARKTQKAQSRAKRSAPPVRFRPRPSSSVLLLGTLA